MFRQDLATWRDMHLNVELEPNLRQLEHTWSNPGSVLNQVLRVDLINWYWRERCGHLWPRRCALAVSILPLLCKAKRCYSTLQVPALFYKFVLCLKCLWMELFMESRRCDCERLVLKRSPILCVFWLAVCSVMLRRHGIVGQPIVRWQKLLSRKAKREDGPIQRRVRF